jgi:hypothetical protein
MINIYGAAPQVTNCTFSGNSASKRGGALANYGASPLVLNSILWGDTAPSGAEISDVSSAPTVAYSILSGGYSGASNLDVDPLLAADLALRPGSPAIDAGSCGASVASSDMREQSRWDIAGVPNAIGGGIDIGAYEYQGNPTTDSVITNMTCESR